MTAVRSIDPAQFLSEHLAQASPDLMRTRASLPESQLMGLLCHCMHTAGGW